MGTNVARNNRESTDGGVVKRSGGVHWTKDSGDEEGIGVGGDQRPQAQ